MKRIKIAFDIDVALIKAWKEKADKRRKEAERFFDLLSKSKENLTIIAAEEVIERIKLWKYKELVEKTIEIFKNYAKTVNAEELTLNFCEKLNKKWLNIVKEFAEKAEIKEEDAAMIIVYSLLNVEYFITFNKKHLRNKFAKLKEVGWKFGLNIPEIMLPSEFCTFLQRYLFNQSSPSSPSSLSTNNYRICTSKLSLKQFFNLFPHNFNLAFKLLLVRKLTLFGFSLQEYKSSSLLLLCLLSTVVILSPVALSATQSHPLSQITPIDTNLNMKVAGTFKSSANGVILC